MLVTAPQVQARQQMTTAINLADGHGTVECINTDPYGLIAKNSAMDVAVPREHLPAALELPALTPCRIIAWCESMAWKDGDKGPAFILIIAKVGKALMRCARHCLLLCLKRSKLRLLLRLTQTTS